MPGQIHTVVKDAQDLDHATGVPVPQQQHMPAAPSRTRHMQGEHVRCDVWTRVDAVLLRPTRQVLDRQAKGARIGLGLSRAKLVCSPGNDGVEIGLGRSRQADRPAAWRHFSTPGAIG